jgi:hypothetical protein
MTGVPRGPRNGGFAAVFAPVSAAVSAASGRAPVFLAQRQSFGRRKLHLNCFGGHPANPAIIQLRDAKKLFSMFFDYIMLFLLAAI